MEHIGLLSSNNYFYFSAHLNEKVKVLRSNQKNKSKLGYIDPSIDLKVISQLFEAD